VSAPAPERPFNGVVAGPAEAHALGPDYVAAAGKVIASHVRNELAGAAVFDEPAIALAPGPREKWLACRIAMEEYGHHLRFARLAAELELPDPLAGRPLSVFDYPLSTWVEFVVLKAIVDLAEVILMEDLTACSYLPLRELAAKLLPEERFHVSFGKSQTRQLADSGTTAVELQAAVDRLVRLTVPFFGRSRSANNELFRTWGIKHLTNDQTRWQFIERSRQFVEGELGLSYPNVGSEWSA
jgi:ring-1,2-phenylacetyl-CoA epoxidase subunit PaaA